MKELLETKVKQVNFRNSFRLENTPNKLDFEDGELKTNKCDKYGNPLETMFITQILSTVDYLLYRKDFYGSRLYKKIDNLLYVPICKEGYLEEWFFLPYEHVNLNKNKYYDLKMQLEDDYYYICDQLIEQIEYGEDGNIHTSNGEFIQIRSKDSKPYSPIYSKNMENMFLIKTMLSISRKIHEIHNKLENFIRK